MSGLNAVSVPMYMVKAAGDALRIMGDTCGRKDLGEVVKNARGLSAQLLRLAKQQSFPGGEEVMAKAQMPKIPDRSWRASIRTPAFKALFEKEILPRFEQLDEGCKGQGRFHLILTYVEG